MDELMNKDQLDELIDKLPKTKLLQVLEYLPCFPSNVKTYFCLNMEKIVNKCYDENRKLLYKYQNIITKKPLSVSVFPYIKYVPSAKVELTKDNCTFMVKYTDIMFRILKLKKDLMRSLTDIQNIFITNLMHILSSESYNENKLRDIIIQLSGIKYDQLGFNSMNYHDAYEIIVMLLDYKFRGYDIYSYYISENGRMLYDIFDSDQNCYSGYYYSLIHGLLWLIKSPQNKNNLQEMMTYLFLICRGLQIKSDPDVFYFLISQTYGNTVVTMIKRNYYTMCLVNPDFVKSISELQTSTMNDLYPSELKSTTPDDLVVDNFRFFGTVGSNELLSEKDVSKNLLHDIYSLQAGLIYSYLPENINQQVVFQIPQTSLIRLLGSYNYPVIEARGKEDYYFMIKDGGTKSFYLLFMNGNELQGIELMTDALPSNEIERNICSFEGLNDSKWKYSFESTELI